MGIRDGCLHVKMQIPGLPQDLLIVVKLLLNVVKACSIYKHEIHLKLKNDLENVTFLVSS